MERSRVRQKKVNKNSGDGSQASYSPPPLESNWADGISFTRNLVRKCYDYYGREPSQRMVVHLNVDEDLTKAPPPPSFLDTLADRLFLPTIFVLLLIIVVIGAYFMKNFDFSAVINLFKNR